VLVLVLVFVLGVVLVHVLVQVVRLGYVLPHLHHAEHDFQHANEDEHEHALTERHWV
jgi:hypothetical protein